AIIDQFGRVADKWHELRPPDFRGKWALAGDTEKFAWELELEEPKGEEGLEYEGKLFAVGEGRRVQKGVVKALKIAGDGASAATLEWKGCAKANDELRCELGSLEDQLK